VGHGRQLVGTTMNQGGLGEKETPAYLCGAGGGDFGVAKILGDV
jgi:hypothetical protein